MREGADGGEMSEGGEIFERHRPLLFSIAYRMLGTVADAEDVVQEAYLRWRRVIGPPVREEVREPGSYLATIVSRLSIDRLRALKARREEYVGPWLPEPLLIEPEPRALAELEESLSMAFLVLLKSLGPTERAVFLLREVFGYEYAEISRFVGKSEANVRQINHRARSALRARRPRFEPSPGEGERLAERFLKACEHGDMRGLLAVLSEDVTLWSDGGGEARAALNPIRGAEKVARFFSGILAKAPPGFAVRWARVNGGPGLIGYFGDGRPHSVATFETAEGGIRVIRLVVNPEKLGTVPPMPGGEEDGG